MTLRQKYFKQNDLSLMGFYRKHISVSNQLSCDNSLCPETNGVLLEKETANGGDSCAYLTDNVGFLLMRKR